MKIFITGGRSIIAYELAQCLLKYKHEIHIIDVFQSNIIKSLAGKITFHKCPSPKLEYQNFENWAFDLYEKIRPEMIIPINEEIFYWAKFAKKHNISILSLEFDDLICLHSKLKFNEFARQIGLNAPRTQIAIPFMNGENYVFKREYSRFGENILIKPKTANFIEINNNPMLAQEYIEGVDFSFYSLINENKILLFCAYKSSWRSKGGAALCFENVEFELKIAAQQIAQKIANNIKGFAQISCDLIIDKNGKIWLIECNPRATSGFHNLSYDFEKINNAFINKMPQNIEEKGAKIGLAMLVYGLFNALKNRNIIKFIKDFNNHRDCLKGLRIEAIKDAINYAIKAKYNGQTLSEFLTHDIEYNGENNEV